MLTGNEKDDVVRRLRRIEGQVRGLADMVEGERYCIDVLTQIAAVHEALRGVGRRVMESHLATCVREADISGSDAERSAKYRELIETIYKFVR
jgi:DNA-binding FrmR family transcriptional regulator